MFRFTSNHGFTDFADTCPAETDYLGRNSAGWRMLGCGCGAGRLRRMKRPFWMRLVPLLRLYQCRRCGAKLLRTRIGGKSTYG